MELAAARGAAPSGGLILAAISAVSTISYVANMLSEDEDWLFELSTTCAPKMAVCTKPDISRVTHYTNALLRSKDVLYPRRQQSL